MKFREQIQAWAVKKVMERYFSGYIYPFERSQAYFQGLSDEAKASYAYKVKELLENEAFDREMQEITRKFYQELALNSQNIEAMTAYRLTLSYIQQWHQHLRRLATHTKGAHARTIKR